MGPAGGRTSLRRRIHAYQREAVQACDKHGTKEGGGDGEGLELRKRETLHRQYPQLVMCRHVSCVIQTPEGGGVEDGRLRERECVYARASERV